MSKTLSEAFSNWYYNLVIDDPFVPHTFEWKKKIHSVEEWRHIYDEYEEGIVEYISDNESMSHEIDIDLVIDKESEVSGDIVVFVSYEPPEDME